MILLNPSSIWTHPSLAMSACGFRKNDIIVEVNGEDVNNSEDADVLLDLCRPGT